MSLAVLDVDHFKTIDDGFGHAAGDQALIRIARLLCDHLRESDGIIRSDGEEFINTEVWSIVADGLSVTTSVGLATTDPPNDLEAVIRLADQWLYEAKRNGRDRVVCGPRLS
jgi:two-component system, cell cycle response regulator